MSVERQYAKEKPFEAWGTLAEIPALFSEGRTPDAFLPQTAEDHAALAILAMRDYPLEQADLQGMFGLSLLDMKLVPPMVFWTTVAYYVYPTLAVEDAKNRHIVPSDPLIEKAQQLVKAFEIKVKKGQAIIAKAVLPESTPPDTPREIAALAARLLDCASLGLGDWATLYGLISSVHLQVLHLLWEANATDEALHDTASVGARHRWFTSSLMLAIAAQSYGILEALYTPINRETPGFPPVALDYLLGRSRSTEGYLLARARILSRLHGEEEQKLVRDLKDAWATLPDDVLRAMPTRRRRQESLTNQLLVDQRVHTEGHRYCTDSVDGSARFHIELWNKGWERSKEPLLTFREGLREQRIEENRGDRGIPSLEIRRSQEQRFQPIPEKDFELPEALVERATSDPAGFEQHVTAAALKSRLTHSDVELLLAKGYYPKDRKRQMLEVYGHEVKEKKLKAAEARLSTALPRIREILSPWLRGNGAGPAAYKPPTARKPARRFSAAPAPVHVLAREGQAVDEWVKPAPEQD